MQKVPNPLFWHFQKQHLKNKQYLKDIDYIAENLDVDYIAIATLEGIVLCNTEQCHGFLKEMADRCHSHGIGFGVRLEPYKGFYNANVFGGKLPPPYDQVQLFPIPDPKKAEAIIEYRSKRPFKSASDIMNVKGIGQKTYEKIKGSICVD